MSIGATSTIMVKSADTSRQCLELRRGGATMREIAQVTGLSVSTVHNAITRGIRKIVQEPAEDVIKLELDRLDGLWVGVWPKAKKGDTKAITSCISIMERRARLLGLDQPTKVDMSDFTATVTLVGVDPESV